jgi:ribosomal-protein-serine acetyltransferase
MSQKLSIAARNQRGLLSCQKVYCMQKTKGNNLTMTDTIPPILRELPDELLGERVQVRPYRAGDGAALWEAVEESREHILPWLPWGDQHRSPTDSEAFVRKCQARWLLREDLPVGIWERATGRFLGGSGLHIVDWEVPSFEIGYWLRRSAVGQGYMTEVVRLLCGLAFETLAANRVFIRCAAGNLRSAAVPRRLGFVHEATLRNDKRNTTGELFAMLVFAMTPEDYAKAQIEKTLVQTR